MERRRRTHQNLTLKLLIFETTAANGRKTFTDEAAEALLLLFPHESTWHADIHKIEPPAAPGCGVEPLWTAHYEMRLTHRTITAGYTSACLTEAEAAIEALCRDFCDPAGALSPRLVNPNPNLVFTVGVNVNNKTDDIFLRSFLKHSARGAGTDGGESKAKGIAPWRNLVSGVAPLLVDTVSSFITDALKREPTTDQAVARDFLSTMIASAGPTSLKALVDSTTSKLIKDSKGGGAAHGQQSRAVLTSAALNQVITCFGGLDRTGAGSRETDAVDLARSTGQCLGSLRDSMSTIAWQHGNAKQGVREAVRGTKAFLLVSCLAVSCTLLSTNLGSVLNISAPEILQVYTRLFSLGSGMGTFYFIQEAIESKYDEKKLHQITVLIHRRLYLTVLDALRSDYRRRPDAASYGRLALDTAALIDPEALEDWDSRAESTEQVDSKLRLLANSLTD